jgi:hypothetical protein
MAGRLAKYKGRVKGAMNAVKNTEKLGSAGHLIVEFGTHAGLALASENMGDIAGMPIKPDTLGFAGGALASMFGKGKVRKLGQAVMRGAGHAFITRWIATKQFTIASGPDGKPRIVDAEVAAAE